MKNMQKGIYFIILMVLLLISCSVNENIIVPPEDRTSIFALIIDPEAYNEQTVTVRGALYSLLYS